MRLHLVEDWRDAWKWLSVRLLVLAMAVQGAMIAMPDTIRQYLPDEVTKWLSLSILAAGILARLVDQPIVGVSNVQPRKPDASDAGS